MSKINTFLLCFHLIFFILSWSACLLWTAFALSLDAGPPDYEVNFVFPTLFLRQEFHLVWGQRCIVPGSPFLSVILHILLFSVSRVLYVYDFFLNVEVSTLLYIFFSQLICILYLFFLSLSTLRSKTHVEIHEWVLYTFVTFFFLFQHYFCLL